MLPTAFWLKVQSKPADPNLDAISMFSPRNGKDAVVWIVGAISMILSSYQVIQRASGHWNRASLVAVDAVIRTSISSMDPSLLRVLILVGWVGVMQIRKWVLDVQRRVPEQICETFALVFLNGSWSRYSQMRRSVNWLLNIRNCFHPRALLLMPGGASCIPFQRLSKSPPLSIQESVKSWFVSGLDIKLAHRLSCFRFLIKYITVRLYTIGVRRCRIASVNFQKRSCELSVQHLWYSIALITIRLHKQLHGC